MSSRPRRILDAPDSPGPTQPGGEAGGPPPPVKAPALPRPWVGYAVLVGAVGMFLAEEFRLIPKGLVAPDGTLLSEQVGPLALYGPLVQAGQYWRMLTAVLEHGGILHLVFNMSVVVTLGFTLERGIGSARFLGLTVVSALGSSAFSLIFNFDVTTVGASGMILGWAGAMLPISTREGRRELFIWLAQVAVLSLLPFVSWAGHLGGFLFGLPCGVALRMGRQVYARALPIILFLTLVVVLFAAHPERRGGM
ncbi:rhomboid family intramembrane serine protease [Pyxidicoccus xibeiensis]|uniref:rhomboid family intramembrane serine protease n=1 Tax=Pyxidicoccus xibeiensis TaxID=2906759 RepID=UPI0020A7C519|nr:rhomboid family intramembrane serine protease [Pyxidicoccus xibeiensis]MCP3145248.1 rhomboid family intramembrane serine protease [Pyxidicoccus xibeiensis]